MQLNAKMQLDPETKFLCALLELQYGQAEVKKIKPLAKEVAWAKGWPKEKKAFWNAEAFLWQRKIEKNKRELISQQLVSLLSPEKVKKVQKDFSNLDLGCGSYSYLSGSTGFDFSEQMLKLNSNCKEKVLGDLEQPLPFASSAFASVTAVFVLNYVKDYPQLLKEVWRVLKASGLFVMVLAEKGVNAWEKQQQTNSLLPKQWQALLLKIGFKVEIFKKAGIIFFLARKV